METASKSKMETASRSKIEIADFSTYIPYTKTYIIVTNLNIKKKYIFMNKILPITPYIVEKKKRGRKKNNAEQTHVNVVNSGSIIRIQSGNVYQGVVLKKQKEKRENQTIEYFRNSITCVMYCIDKLITFKISDKGTFQLTGCKTQKHAEMCVLYIWSYIKSDHKAYSFITGTNLVMTIEPVMNNISFSADFRIDRKNLDHYINQHTPYISIYEEDFGYAGVNIKIPVNLDTDIRISSNEYVFGKDKRVIRKTLSYKKYCSDKQKQKKNCDKLISFMVFRSGRVLMSGPHPAFMEEPYYIFLKLINEARKHIEEL